MISFVVVHHLRGINDLLAFMVRNNVDTEYCILIIVSIPLQQHCDILVSKDFANEVLRTYLRLLSFLQLH